MKMYIEKGSRKKQIIYALIMSVLAFFSLRYILDNNIDNFVEAIFFSMPIILAIFFWFSALFLPEQEDDGKNKSL